MRKSNKIIFSHNPFSMPQDYEKNKKLENPLKLKAYQYDIVCNGVGYPQERLETIFQNLCISFFQ